MRYYAIADLHGRYDLLLKAIEAISTDRDADCVEYKIITLGDYIDRGPMSKQIIATLMDRQDGSQDGDRLICLQGNHEDMAIQVMSNMTDRMINWWDGNGGSPTWKSYGEAFPTAVDPEHIKWMANLPYFYETEKQLFVHAGVPQSNMNLPPKNLRHREEMMWMLYDKTDGRGWKDKHVVHGHHQFADGPHEWQGRTDLDTYAWRTGRLVVGVFDDTQGKALRYLEVLGDDYGDQREQLGSTYS